MPGPTSAVPVLPFTVASALEAAVPVPYATTARIISATFPATARDTTRRLFLRSLKFFGYCAIHGGCITPLPAITWATDPISSGVAVTPAWPIPATPRIPGLAPAVRLGIVLRGNG